ncbi:MAG: hypothetical protein ABJZ62_11745 [Hyphomicrobiales bacterium]
MPKTKNITIAIVLALGVTNLILSGSSSFAQTKVDVPTNIDRGVIEPPKCVFPCKDDFVLPAFARSLSLAGPEGRFETELNRGAFLTRLEDWRRHLELYRLSIEEKQFKAPEWKKANILYRVELGKYDQFFESYQNAIAMDRGGRITYGK